MRDINRVALLHTSTWQREVGRNADAVVCALLRRRAGWQMYPVPHGSEEDVLRKVDAWVLSGPEQGRSVQISCRTGRAARDDFAISVAGKTADSKALTAGTVREMIERYPTKLSGCADLHVLLSADRTALHVADGRTVTAVIEAALRGLDADPEHQGRMLFHKLAYCHKGTGVEFRTSQSFEGWSILAYLPANRVRFLKIDLDPEEVNEEFRRVEAVRAGTGPAPAA